MRTLFAVFTILVLFAHGAGAAPVISGVSGTVTHGQAVTISGASFGTRADYNEINDTWNGHRYMNFRWTDFSFSTFLSSSAFNANKTLTDGFYPQRGGAYWTEWAIYGLSLENGGPSQSGRFLKRKIVGLSPESGGSSVDMPAAADAYQTLYLANKFAMISTGTTQQSGKAWRIWGDGTAGSIYHTSGGNYGLGLRGDGASENCPVGFDGDGINWGGPFEFTLGQWERVDLWMDRPTGYVRQYVNGAIQGSPMKWWCDFGLGGHTIDVPDMINAEFRGEGIEGSYNFSDVYIDFTLARVELCNANTFAASTACEVQLPISWNANSIQIAVNRGEFATSQQVYAYVIDSSGAVNASGYAVTIGSGGTTPVPVVSTLDCTPTTLQAPGTTTCTATASNATSYAWAFQSCGSPARCSTAETDYSAIVSCGFGGACTPCVTATGPGGTSAQYCAAANYLTIRYVKPSGFGAN